MSALKSLHEYNSVIFQAVLGRMLKLFLFDFQIVEYCYHYQVLYWLVLGVLLVYPVKSVVQFRAVCTNVDQS